MFICLFISVKCNTPVDAQHPCAAIQLWVALATGGKGFEEPERPMLMKTSIQGASSPGGREEPPCWAPLPNPLSNSLVL